MPALRRTSAALAAVATLVAMAGVDNGSATAASPVSAVTRATPRWPGADRTGSVRLTGQVPLSVQSAVAGLPSGAALVGSHSATDRLSLNFSLPLHDKAGLDALIATEAKTHQYPTHAEVAARFAPPAAQVSALKSWLTSQGYTITHLDASGTAIAASAPTSVVESTLGTKIVDLQRKQYVYQGVTVPSYSFFSNTLAPRLPARLGVSAVSGLSDVDRFFTQAQLNQGALKEAAVHSTRGGTAGPNATDTRTEVGYYPADLRQMYDVAGHNIDATGQTVGFTLWGPNETQQAMDLFSTTTGDTDITLDAACTATGNSATKPSACVATKVAADHELAILENGNDNGTDPTTASSEYGIMAANIETALDMEQAHGIAPGVAEKYYLANCTAAPPANSGLSTGSTCNGTDVGLEESIEDAANDPTLHSVSNSWGYGGEAEWGRQDPFRMAAETSFALGAAAGTTFWFSTGDSGTYESGFPADNEYVTSVGGTSLYSTANLTPIDDGTTTVRSTATAWAAGGSWCSVVEDRPSWQTGPDVTAKSPCPGRITPDISAIADSNTSVLTAFSAAATNGVGVPAALPVGGTSVAAPEMNGMEALTEAFLAKQTYPGGKTPAIGFEGPMFYQLGNSVNGDRYFNDTDCGNTANPAAGPDGDAAGTGWDPATGWGEIDWFHWSTGYAIALGATGLAQPTSLATDYDFSCAQTPTNAAQRGVSMPSTSIGYSVGSPAATPWPGLFLTSGAWGASNTFLKTTDGGLTYEPTNSDMEGVACISAATCIEVGDGGRIRRTTDSGTTWTYVTSPFDKALTSIVCPSTTICYASGDRGVTLKSTDAGATWAYVGSADGNPLRGLSCPSTTVCYAVDGYAHVEKTTNGGTSWTLMSTPVTTPGVDVPGSGGPNPFAGLYGISCTSTTDCVAVGGFPPTGTDSPIVVTTDGGATWKLKVSNSGAGNTLNGVTCLGFTCYAVGAGGAIVTSGDSGNTWTAMTSNTTVQLTGISCTAAGTCVATGQGGLVDVLSGTTWTVTGAQAAGNFLAAVTCLSATNCLAVGKEGATLAFNPAALSGAKLEAGGGPITAMNALSCVDTATCVAVGAGGLIYQTTNSGQTWLARTSGTTTALTGVSCIVKQCTAVGGSNSGAVIIASKDGGATWAAQTTDAMTALAAISCTTDKSCVAVGGTGEIVQTTDGGATYTDETSGTMANLTGVSCVIGKAAAPSTAVAATSCYASGAVFTGDTDATIVLSKDNGATWTSATDSKSPQGLTNITCTNRYACFASGAIGTIVTTTDGGTTWAQQGDPISGPTTALNAGPAAITATYASACDVLRCTIGTASAGDIMTTPTVIVTVNTGGKSMTAPALINMSPNAAGITYSPTAEAANMLGSLTCTTTATATSANGVYPITGCSGLRDPGHSVYYDIDASTYNVGVSPQKITFPAIAAKTYGDAAFLAGATASSGLAVAYTATGDCTVAADGKITITGAGTCTITANQSGNSDFSAAPAVSQTFAIAKATPKIAVGVPGHRPMVGLKVNVGAILSTTFGVVPTGKVTLTSGTATCTATIASANGLAECQEKMYGGHPVLKGAYAGDKNFLPVSISRTVEIARAKPGLGLVRKRVTPGKQQYRINLHIFGTSGFTPTGTVKLTIAGSTCTATIANSVGSCTLTIPKNTTKPLHIRYSGDSNYQQFFKQKTFPNS